MKLNSSVFFFDIIDIFLTGFSIIFTTVFISFGKLIYDERLRIDILLLIFYKTVEYFNDDYDKELVVTDDELVCDYRLIIDL